MQVHLSLEIEKQMSERVYGPVVRSTSGWLYGFRSPFEYIHYQSSVQATLLLIRVVYVCSACLCVCVCVCVCVRERERESMMNWRGILTDVCVHEYTCAYMFLDAMSVCVQM